MASAPDAEPIHRPHRARRITVAVVVTLLCAGIMVELIARVGLGLGDPPLFLADPDIEYMGKPGEYHRFSNRIQYNDYAMRSDAFPPSKANERERRILFYGDSVINGGTLTDQHELATERLSQRLAARQDAPVTMGNASAGSWGPPNLLAHARKFGLLDADVVVLVLNSYDADDVPDDESPVGRRPDLPAQPPLLATQELLTRYVWPRLRATRGGQPAPRPVERPLDSDAARQAMDALEQMIALARAADARVVVVQHLDADELARGRPHEGHALIQQTAEEAGVDLIVQLGPAFEAAMADGVSPYRDRIHPNAAGQAVMAEALEAPLLDQLRAEPASASPDASPF